MAKKDMDVTVVIPARYGSSRFPGKPLVSLLGKPIIRHVYERAAACRAVREVVVATDDERIRTAVERFGGRVVMMTDPYRTGTDRVAGVARTHPGRVFLDLQGDEVLLSPELLTDLIDPFLAGDAVMGTLVRPLRSREELHNPAVVKAVVDQRGQALYFSRAPIPLVRDDPARNVVAGLHCIHLGLYIYTRETLLQFASLPTGALEDAEKLEQLRALEFGIPIHVWQTTHTSLRIDTPDDVAQAEQVLREQETARCGS
jgi:3-deoxy-manno-octulosonate cytidylyltransferase (CMP-KDO synthetase)